MSFFFWAAWNQHFSAVMVVVSKTRSAAQMDGWRDNVSMRVGMAFTLAPTGKNAAIKTRARTSGCGVKGKQRFCGQEHCNQKRGNVEFEGDACDGTDVHHRVVCDGLDGTVGMGDLTASDESVVDARVDGERSVGIEGPVRSGPKHVKLRIAISRFEVHGGL